MKNILNVEFYKLKRIKSLYLIIILPVILIGMSIYDFAKNVGQMGANSSAGKLFLYHMFLNFFTFFSPFFIALFVFSLVQLEFKNGSWENLLLLARSKSKIYLSKLIVAISMTIIYCLVTYLLFTIAKKGLSVAYPKLLLSGFADWPILVLFLQYTSIYVMLTTFFFNLYLYFENPITSLGIVFFLLVTGLVVMNSKFYIYIPLTYSYKLMQYFNEARYWNEFTRMSILWLIIFLVFGYILFLRFWKAQKS
ncbi:ABC transporter permease [Arachidicoccus terrestris]|uniref:ABC transporter permease n=1 Tax=Arachidicoccus terrestris TaxID=2875539 RepID=UPI001CC70439|nr:ABC transporter permease [Arachidicoccus terrestris]UAY56728.1 ABC transporter permease [Arachidicoccus terrestris]